MDDDIVISGEVLAAIAVTAARETEGVSALLPRYGAPARLFLRKQEHQHLAKITDGDTLEVELTLRVRAGIKLTALGAQVQRAVKQALETMTDKTVTRVNLVIQGVDM